MFRELTGAEFVNTVGVRGVAEITRVILMQSVNLDKKFEFSLQTITCKVNNQTLFVHIESNINRELKTLEFKRICVSDVRVPDELLDRYNQLIKELESYQTSQEPIFFTKTPT